MSSWGWKDQHMGFKIWFTFCATLGVGMLGLVAWATLRLVTHFTGG